MRAGDEVIFGGKTYVAADAKLIQAMFNLSANWMQVCGYCKKVCQSDVCISLLRRRFDHADNPLFCSTYKTHFFLKPQRLTGESK